LPLAGNRIVLGRDPACDIVIDEAMVRRDSAPGRPASVSRRHAVISCVRGNYYIEDGDGKVRSRNGTFVNNKPISDPILLENNDHIRICGFDCTFLGDREATLPVEASIDHESSSHSLQTQPAEKLRVILEISNSLSNTLDVDALHPPAPPSPTSASGPERSR
jgi:pSer/pThr/pTyr-binding forkhead associated (FHA) protein